MRSVIARAGRLGAVLLVIPLVLAAAAPAAFAAPAGVRDETDDWVAVTGQAWVRAGDLVHGVVLMVNGDVVVDGQVDGDVVVFRGDAVVNGHVSGAVTVLSGTATVTGRVAGDVVVVRGTAAVTASGSVGGDVSSSRRPVITPGATVDGSVRTIPGFWLGALPFVLLAGLWFAVSVSALLLGLGLLLLVPRAAAAVVRSGTARWAPALGWGTLVAVAVPVAGAIAAGTLVALPLGLGLFAFLAVLYPVGYVTGALLLGRTMLGRSGPVAAFLAGLAVLRLLALVPVLGGLVSVAATLFGLGAIVVAIAAAGRPGARAAAGPAARFRPRPRLPPRPRNWSRPPDGHRRKEAVGAGGLTGPPHRRATPVGSVRP